MNNKNIEKLYPYVISLLILALFHFLYKLYQDNLIIQRFSDLLNISLTLSGISLGFIGTMIGAILSITNSKVMSIIYSENADIDLMNYIREAAIVNLLVLFFSIVLLLTAKPNENPSFLIYPWFFVFVCSFLCSFRIIHLLFSLLDAVNKEHRAKHNNKVHIPDKTSFTIPKFDDNDSNS